MNIIFADKLSDTLFTTELCWDAGGYLPRWLLHKMQGGYCIRETDHPKDILGAPLYRQQSGAIPVLVIGVDAKDVTRALDGTLRTNYFSWAIYGVPVDMFGEVETDMFNQCNGDNKIVNGGLINRKPSTETPAWESHT